MNIIGKIVYVGGDEGKYINQLLDLDLLEALATVIEQTALEAPEMVHIALWTIFNIMNEKGTHAERVVLNDRLFAIVVE